MGGLVKNTKAWALREFDDAKPRLYYPHELLEKFIEYNEWVENNPLKEGILHQKSGELIDVPKMRAMTVKGFCLYAGIAQNTFYSYAKQPEYKVIIQAIEDAIYVQKFEGASAGLLNTNIIIRDLGLTDIVKHNLVDSRKTVDELFPSVEEIDAIVVDETSPEEVKKLNENNENNENNG
jgi:hypothetical protein